MKPCRSELRLLIFENGAKLAFEGGGRLQMAIGQMCLFEDQDHVADKRSRDSPGKMSLR